VRCRAAASAAECRPTAPIKEIDMQEVTASAPRTIEDRLKLAGLVLGLLSTALGVWVAFKAQIIDAAVSATQNTTADIQKQLMAQEGRIKDLSLKNMEHDARVHLRVSWRVMPANEFAQVVKAPNNNLAWTDPVLQEQLVREADAWFSGRYLMGRTADKALLLRQVVCLELSNVGATPASGLRLLGAPKDFALSRAGVGDAPFGSLQVPAATEALGADLGALMAGAPNRGAGAEIIIPLAQVVGPARYVGRVVLPRKLVWKNERLGKEESVPVDAASMALQARLKAAYLGHSLDDVVAQK
jgi:hypothetical protein